MTARIKSVSGEQSPGKSPSAQAVATRPEYSATDVRGRVITLRKPTTWEKFSLPRILGADSINPGWQFQAQMLLHVKRIGDDEDVFFSSDREMKAVVEQLGDDGMECVEQLFIDHFMTIGEAQRDEIKK